jgi:hypothetical protein
MSDFAWLAVACGIAAILLLMVLTTYFLRAGGMTAAEYRRSKQAQGLKTFSVAGWLRNYVFDTASPAWAVQKHGTDGYRGLRCLESGDHLTVRNRWGLIVWQGVVEFEYESGFVQFPDCAPGDGVQRVWDQTVTGCQRDMSLEQWAGMFIAPDGVRQHPLHGTLTWVPSQSRITCKQTENLENALM